MHDKMGVSVVFVVCTAGAFIGCVDNPLPTLRFVFASLKISPVIKLVSNESWDSSTNLAAIPGLDYLTPVCFIDWLAEHWPTACTDTHLVRISVRLGNDKVILSRNGI